MARSRQIPWTHTLYNFFWIQWAFLPSHPWAWGATGSHQWLWRTSERARSPRPAPSQQTTASFPNAHPAQFSTQSLNPAAKLLSSLAHPSQSSAPLPFPGLSLQTPGNIYPAPNGSHSSAGTPGYPSSLMFRCQSFSANCPANRDRCHGDGAEPDG